MVNKPDNSKGTILILDDEEIIHLSLKRLLADSNYKIESAYNGKEALLKAKNKYDLIISDIKMQGLSGIDVLHELKKTGVTSEVIMLTGYASLDTATDAINSGAFGYFMKPIDDITDFKYKVDEAIHRAQLRQQNEFILDTIKSGQIEILNSLEILPLNTKLLEENPYVLKQFLQMLPEGIVILDSSNNIQFCNVRFAEENSIEYQQIVNRPFIDFFSDDDKPNILKIFSHLQSGATVINNEIAIVSTFNSFKFISLSALPIINNNDYKGAILIISHLDEIKKMKKKLELLSQLFEENIYDMIFVLNESGQINLCNILARNSFGYSPNEIIGANINLLFKSNETWKIIQKSLTKERVWEGACKAFSKQGILLPIQMIVKKIPSKDALDDIILCHMKITAD